MKAINLYTLLFAALPLVANAQDDLYYTPKKKVQTQQRSTVVQTPATNQSKITEVRITPDHVAVIKGNDTVPEPAMESRVEEIEDDVAYGEATEGWVNGFDGSESDYEYARRLLGVRTLRVGIPVGSSLYYDLIYGPYAYDWNVYIDGGYAYIFPTWANPIYHDFLIHGYNWYCFGWGWGMSYWRHGWYFHDWYHHYYHPHYGRHPHNYTAMAPHRTYNGRYVTHGSRAGRVSTHRTGDGRIGYSRGRVVNGSSSRGGAYSRPSGARTGDSHYSRPEGGSRPSSTYTRPSSTRRTVEGANGGYSRSGQGSVNSRPSSSNRQSYSRSGSTSSSSRSYTPSGGGASSSRGSSGGGHGAGGSSGRHR